MNRAFLLSSLLLLSSAGTSVAETIEDVENQILEKSRAVKSLSAKFKSTTSMEMPGYSSKSTTEGTYQSLNRDGKTLYRQESKTVAENDIGGQKSKTENEVLSICTGKETYTVTDDGTNKFASKMAVPPAAEARPFDAMREMYEMKVLDGESVAGRDCFVIESTPKDPAMAAMTGKSVSYWCKKTGFQVKMVAYGADGKPMTTHEYTDIEVDGDVDEGQFRWDDELAGGAPIQEIGG